MHGTPKTVTLYGHRSNHEMLAEIITNRRDYDGTKEIRLFSCSTGKADKNGDCFAQRLANKLGQVVWAPDDTIWLSSDGKFSIGPSEDVCSGSMVRFEPK